MRVIPVSVPLLIEAAVGVLPSCTQDAAPSDPTRRFVVTLGRDTVQLEELTVEPDGSFFGQTVRRVGGTVIDRFEGKVRGDFQIERFESTTRDPLVPEDATPLQRVAFSRVDDSVFVEVTSPEGVYRHAFGSDQVVIAMAAYSSLVNLELALQLTPTHTRREMLFVGPVCGCDRHDDEGTV